MIKALRYYSSPREKRDTEKRLARAAERLASAKVRFPDIPTEITPELDRHNGLIFIACTGLLYFAAPVHCSSRFKDNNFSRAHRLHFWSLGVSFFGGCISS